VGVIATVLVHSLLFLLLFTVFSDGLAVPVSTTSLEIVFEEPQPEKRKLDEPARTTTVVRNVSSGAPAVPERVNVPTQKAGVDDFGDVEKVVESPTPIDNRSLFQSNDQGETQADSAEEQVDTRTLFRGFREGENVTDNAQGATSSFDLKGRSVVKKLVQPENTSNKEGRVVVEITVDQYGKVMTARARARGSSIQDDKLWKAAQDAALQTIFNTDLNSPAFQVGTITYIFRLK
jgi:hypothetical protein